MADFALDDVMDEEDLRLEYRMGHMHPQDAYDNGIIDELGYEISYVPTKVRLMACRYCGEKGLHWECAEGKWRLYTPQGDLHSCSNYILCFILG